MGDVHLFVGPKGVGKTTVLSRFLTENPEFEHVNYASELLDIAADEGILTEDELRLRPREREYLREQTSAAIAESAAAREVPTIVDGHFLLPTTHGFLPGFLVDDVRLLDPTKIIVLDASAETIRKRLEDDDQRETLYASLTQIDRHRELVQTATMCASMTVDARTYFVDNDEPDVETTVTELRDLFNRDVERIG